MVRSQPGSRCVLVVDDDDAVVALVAEVLEDDGFAVLVAFDGDDAWRMLHVHAPRPDVVLLDLRMPNVDGLSLLRRLEAEPHFADIPVVLMSGDESLRTITGAAGHLAKPLELGALLEVTRGALERRGRPGPERRDTLPRLD